MYDNEIELIWESMASMWTSLCPPWRPSEDDLAIYKEFITGVKPNSILIFGSTPELRDVASDTLKNGGEITTIDANEQMINRTAKLIRRPPHREKILAADWNTVDLPADKYDLILGDVFWHWLDNNQQNNLLKRISRSMKDQAIFVSRFRIEHRSTGCACIRALTRVIRALPQAKHNPENWPTDRSQNAIWLDLTKKIHKRTNNQSKEQIVLALSREMSFYREEISGDYICAPYYPIFALKKRDD